MVDWISLLSALLGENNYNSTSNLEIPVDLHIYDTYYGYHDSYKFIDEYSFDNKILIFDQKLHRDQSSSNNHGLENIKYLNKTRFLNREYQKEKHHRDHRIDWTNNNGRTNLKDILRLDLTKKDIFTPIAKNIYLDYSHKHSSKIDFYSFYFDKGDEDNKVWKLSFGKLKSNKKTLENLYTSGVNIDHSSKCSSATRNYHRSQIKNFYFEEEGFEGVCEQLDIAWYNINFPSQKTLWSTPYVAYKYTETNYWKKSWHYFILGHLLENQGRSRNLIQNSKDNHIWFVNYDDVFSLVFEEGKFKLKLNEFSELVQKLKESGNNKENTQLVNFLKVSSYLDFKVSYFDGNKKQEKEFKFKDVLEDKAVFVESSNKNVISQASLSVVPSDKNKVSLVDFTSYKYKINLDNLAIKSKIFDDVYFDVNLANQLFPSELLDVEKLNSLFVFTFDNEKYKFSSSSDAIKQLDIRGWINDWDGTAQISYLFNNKRHTYNLNDMQRMPNLDGISLEGKNIEDIQSQLKERYSDVPSYFWGMIKYKPRLLNYFSNSNIKLDIEYPKFHDSALVNIVNRKAWEVKRQNITIPNTEDVFPVLKSNLSKYDQISDLFYLNEYSASAGLKKSDYKFEIADVSETRMLIDVTLEKSSERIDRFKSMKEKPYKRYTVDLENVSNKLDKDKKNKDENSYSGIENGIMWGAGSIFTLTSFLMLIKKFPILKSKFLKFKIM
ncbi:hypothetical protein [Candidatus Mycoplasma haematohominis]|uniref:Uncharacterized protein n=1 Tax=Candidatus Mycoplasma haematohominis TaxID=1494318 RepID=A0A478FTE4_9MOLU|nr:hypothetical protein [Candidatus Mycoplasma haemohominis]GCE63280.1 hypothetical protein MHSWG343_02670 [Candidatus Mycoplasma haemohominis]